MGDLGMIKEGLLAWKLCRVVLVARGSRGTPDLPVAQGLPENKRGTTIINNRQTNATICMT